MKDDHLLTHPAANDASILLLWLWKRAGGSTEMRSGFRSAKSVIARSNVRCNTPGGSAAVRFGGMGQRALYCLLPRPTLAQVWLQLTSMKPGSDSHCPLLAHVRHCAELAQASGGPRSTGTSEGRTKLSGGVEWSDGAA